VTAADPVFVASAFGRTGITPTVGLGIPLYVIHATFVSPRTNADAALPPHHWVLWDTGSGAIVSISGPSNASGVCSLSDVADPGTGPFMLGFVPAPVDTRNFFLDNGEAWLDLDATPLAWATPQPDRTQLERRNLFRIPAWTTRRKARRGGGFKAWPDKARPETKDTGLLNREDVLHKPFGSIATPWEIAIDFNWVHATVRHFFFDWGRDKQGTLPPGLFVDAVPVHPDGPIARLGAGTAIKDGDGSARMMLEVDVSKWGGIQFQFTGAAETRVDLSAPEPAAGAKDTRLTATGAAPTDRNVRNLLPVAWHSRGHRCSATGGGKSYGNEWTKVASKLVGDNVDDVDVEFHLDDVQLTEKDGTVRTKDTGRPALFDHFMKLIDPVTARPHLSDTTVDGSFVIADKAFTIGKGALAAGQKRLELSTRLIHVEGQFFDLRDERVKGTPGTTFAIGARAAVHNDHLLVDYGLGNPFFNKLGFYEMHVIDVPGVQDPVGRQPLMHMFVYISCSVDGSGIDASKIDDFYKIFTTASERWSQGSPGVPTPTKDYRIVAKDPTQRKAIIRPRFYFGELFHGGTFSNRPLLRITLKHSGDRSSTDQVPGWWLKGGDMTLFDSSVEYTFSRSGGSAQDSDGVSAYWHTLAHEFGHAMGLPDEYGEELDPSTVDTFLRTQNPRVLGYDQQQESMPSDYRPFYGDRFAIMNQNALPRLRHYWHHLEALSRDAAFQSVPGTPFVLRHQTLGGGIEFVHPVDEHAHPFTPLFFDKPIPSGLGKCALFPVGQDEGTAEAMFSPPDGGPAVPLPTASRIDGVLVLRPRIRFRFDSSISPNEQWKTIWENFIEQLYDRQHRERVRFVLIGGSKLSRIAIAVEPLCAVGAAPFTSDDFELMLSNKMPIPPNPFAAGRVPSTIDVDILHFNVFGVLRAILGVPSSGPPGVANTTPLTRADFVNVANLVDRELGDAPGTRSAMPL
jgi:hypothetical protein